MLKQYSAKNNKLSIKMITSQTDNQHTRRDDLILRCVQFLSELLLPITLCPTCERNQLLRGKCQAPSRFQKELDELLESTPPNTKDIRTRHVAFLYTQNLKVGI